MKNLKMEVYNNIIKNNKQNIKQFKTESVLKSKDYSMVSSLKQKIINQFNYRLFKLNEKNRELFINKNNHCNSRELYSHIKVKNYNNNSIKNININNSNSKTFYFNNKFAKSSKYLDSFYSTNTSNLKIIPKHIQNKKYYSVKTNDLVSEIKLNNRIENKLNLGLVPLNYKKKNYKLAKRKKLLGNNLYNDQGELYKNNNDIDILSRTNYTNNKGLIKKSNNFWNIRIKTNNIDLKTEENDMKPKIRFINLKKDLLEENLKINRMFADFYREIAEKEKSLKFIGKHKSKNNCIKENNE